MAEAEPLQLEYVPEVVLKKRKRHETSWALARKAQLELGKHKAKNKRMPYIKKAEEFVKAFRAKELDLIQMKRRVKLTKLPSLEQESKLLFIIRIQCKNVMHPESRKILRKLRLHSPFHGVFMKETRSILGMLCRVQPFVTYGYPNPKNVSNLIYKKGNGKVNKSRVPLIDNAIIEQALGKYGILCLEDMVHEIVSVGTHFCQVAHFLGPFALNRPKQGLAGNKSPFKNGGDAGNRADQINDLISKMN